jgi:hypothetical protein
VPGPQKHLQISEKSQITVSLATLAANPFGAVTNVIRCLPATGCPEHIIIALQPGCQSKEEEV